MFYILGLFFVTFYFNIIPNHKKVARIVKKLSYIFYPDSIVYIFPILSFFHSIHLLSITCFSIHPSTSLSIYLSSIHNIFYESMESKLEMLCLFTLK